MTKATLKVSTFHPFHLQGKDRNGQAVGIVKMSNRYYLAMRGDGEIKEFTGSTPLIEVVRYLA